MKTVYLVQAHGGQWEDSWTLPVKVVGTEQRAKELVEEYQKESDDHHEKMEWYQENFDEMPEHLLDITWDDGEVMCSERCTVCEIESYVPSMDSSFYTYEVVEMED